MPGIDDRVLDGARRALERHGFHATTLERIAEEAGLSRVTLFRRGITKEAVLEALADEAQAAYRDRMWPLLTGAGAPAERLEHVLLALCDLADERLGVLQAIDDHLDAVFHAQAGPPAGTRSAYTEPIARLLRDGVQDGSLRTDDPEADATLVFNAVGLTYLHLRTRHGWSHEQARGKLVAMALAGLGA